mgnify:CR=1 FL=1
MSVVVVHFSDFWLLPLARDVVRKAISCGDYGLAEDEITRLACRKLGDPTVSRARDRTVNRLERELQAARSHDGGAA